MIAHSMDLRDYQRTFCDNVLSQFEIGSRSTLGILPTGCGKTVCFSTIARDWKEGRVLILAHREELIFQAADKIEAITGDRPEIEMADYRAARHGLLTASNVIVSSVQTQNSGKSCPVCSQLSCDFCQGEYHKCPQCSQQVLQCEICLGGIVRRMQRFDPEEFGLVIVDEGHHATADSYRRILAYYGRNPNLKVLLVTATPDRADEQAMGSVCDSVAFEYGILDAINDGWLVPIKQQWVTVDGLDLSKVKTTAGDLNQGELEAVMVDEENIHGIVSPTMEIAGDRATLVFTASVAQAELTKDVFNRHRSNSAICIHGGTDKDERRVLLERYSKGEFQYLCGCGVFLEGFDEPRIQVIAMARPTKSRSLYAQAIGRGTRPIYPPREATREERKAAILASPKPEMLVLDFVGNSGRHKLISTADILGDALPDEFVERAVKLAQSKGKPVDMLTEFEDLEKIVEDEKRKKIVAHAKFSAQSMDPFDIFDLTPPREPGWHQGRKPTDKQIECLERWGVPTKELSFVQASKLMDTMIKRRKENLASFKQIKVLRKYGVDASNWEFTRASGHIDKIAKNGWKPVPVEAAPF